MIIQEADNGAKYIEHLLPALAGGEFVCDQVAALPTELDAIQRVTRWVDGPDPREVQRPRQRPRQRQRLRETHAVIDEISVKVRVTGYGRVFDKAHDNGDMRVRAYVEIIEEA